MRWTSGSFENGEAVEVKDLCCEQQPVTTLDKDLGSARLWQKAAVLITLACRFLQVIYKKFSYL